MLDVGAQVEKYEVLERLGGGGFADVYKARHIHLGTIHALKILKQEHVGNESIRLRFLDEARVQAQLVHPNIARVTDIIVTEGIAGLVMEYLEGHSLADFIEERQGPASEDEILAIMLPVLEALHFAHERGVIHRDVKPDNIFLAVDNTGAQIPKVLDFGIAKVRGELRQEGKRKSTVATGMGTEGYASPEQLKNAADVDRRADIFSVGVTLYELATGRLPFERDSDVESLMALMNGDYTIPEELRTSAPQIARAIEKALQTDRENRFADCEALMGALRPATRGRQPAAEAVQMPPAPVPRSAARRVSGPAAWGPPPAERRPVPPVPQPEDEAPGPMTAATRGAQALEEPRRRPLALDEAEVKREVAFIVVLVSSFLAVIAMLIAWSAF